MTWRKMARPLSMPISTNNINALRVSRDMWLFSELASRV
jgi:hypothetical protein